MTKKKFKLYTDHIWDHKEYIACFENGYYFDYPFYWGLKITPQIKNIRAWICHPDDKGMYDLMRYLSKVSGVTKRDIETAVIFNTPLKKYEN